MRKFQVDVNIVELNSTGLMAAIGFSDQLRITQIFMDELNVRVPSLFLRTALPASYLVHHPSKLTCSTTSSSYCSVYSSHFYLSYSIPSCLSLLLHYLQLLVLSVFCFSYSNPSCLSNSFSIVYTSITCPPLFYFFVHFTSTPYSSPDRFNSLFHFPSTTYFFSNLSCSFYLTLLSTPLL